MPAIRSPGVVLKLWTKAKDAYEGKKPAAVKNGEKEKTGIKNLLNGLRDLARKGATSPDARQDFVTKQDVAVRALKRYCQFLKVSKDDDKARLKRFLTTVKQLTVVVQGLDAGNLDANEDDVNLDVLSDVDTSALDKALAEGNNANAPPPQWSASSAPQAATTDRPTLGTHRPPAPDPVPTQPPVKPPVPPKPEVSPLSLEPLVQRLAKIRPLIDEAKKHPLIGAKVAAMVAEIEKALQAGNAQAANDKLKVLATVLKQVLAKPAQAWVNGTKPTTDPKADQPISAERRVGKLRKNFEAAVVILNLTTEGFAKGVEQLQGELAKLGEEVPPGVVSGLARASQGLPPAAAEFDSAARALQPGVGDVAPMQAKAAAALNRLTQYLSGDPLVQLVRQNPFKPVSTAVLEQALATLRQKCLAAN